MILARMDENLGEEATSSNHSWDSGNLDEFRTGTDQGDMLHRIFRFGKALKIRYKSPLDGSMSVHQGIPKRK